MFTRFQITQIDVFGIGHRTRTPVGTAQVGRTQSIGEITRTRIPVTISSTIIPPRYERDHLFTVQIESVRFLVELITASPTAMSRGEVVQTGVLGRLLQGELYGKRILTHENRIRLSCLLQIIHCIEQRKSIINSMFFIRIILQFQRQTMSFGIPVADVSANPSFPFQFFGQWSYLHFVKYGIHPVLPLHLIIIELAHTETGEETHQL